MNIKLIYLSRNKNNNIELLANDYEKKINHFVKFSSFCLKNKSQSNEKSQIIKCESDLILKNINKEDTVVLLDEKGKEYSSYELADLISTNMMDRTKNLTFVIGGAYGFSKKFKKMFKFKISLSKLTFPHDMARLFFCEQLYRSFTIINNIPYHNK